MTENQLRYPTILFDWGDTIMRDHPEITTPMVEWETIEVIEGIADLFAYLHISGRRIVMATSASISDEAQIHGALARCGLDQYFSHIYCFKNTDLPKSEALYRYILNDLDIPASQAMMVGDSFEKDVQAANAVEMFAVWFNPNSAETRKSNLHDTIHSMQELRMFFNSRE
jgi:FMN phosphatase YigB (HAD superfamily)